MSYIDKDILKNSFLSESKEFLYQAMATVNRKRVEQDILKEVGPAFQPFLCTDEPIENEFNMTLSDEDLLEELHDSIRESKAEAKYALKQLQKLRVKYPKMPVIYNFISVAYQVLGQKKKSYHVTKMVCKKFPDYLFGKIGLAEHSLANGHHEAVPEIFNHKLQLYMHYPETEAIPTFHVSEVEGFYTIIGRYYARSKKPACAIKCYFLIEEISNHSPHLDALVIDIFAAEIMTVVTRDLEVMKKQALE